MAFDLSRITRATKSPPRITIYGTPGVGKTLLASMAHSDEYPALLVPIEDGTASLIGADGQCRIPTTPQPKTYDDLIEIIDALLTEDHNFRWLVIDSLDKLEPLIWDHVCENVKTDKGKTVDRIEDYGYGKGYKHALTEWRRFTRGFDALRDRKGMGIIAIAHSIAAKVKSPMYDDYDQFAMRLQETAREHITDWTDALMFLNYEAALIGEEDERKRAVGKGRRLIHTQERPAYRAKNRYRLPPTITLDDKVTAEESAAAAWATIASSLNF